METILKAYSQAFQLTWHGLLPLHPLAHVLFMTALGDTEKVPDLPKVAQLAGGGVGSPSSVACPEPVVFLVASCYLCRCESLSDLGHYFCVVMGGLPIPGMLTEPRCLPRGVYNSNIPMEKFKEFIVFFKRFYLFMRDRERQREKQAP